MRFGGVLLLLSVLAVYQQVHGICLETVSGNVMSANDALELSSVKSCDSNTEWNLIPIDSNFYIQHVPTGAYLIGQLKGVVNPVFLVADPTLSRSYEWQQTEVDSGVFTFLSLNIEALQNLKVDSNGVTLGADNGPDEQFIKK